MKVFFGCFITPECAKRLRASWNCGLEQETYLEDYAQGVMVRPPGACLDLHDDVRIPPHGCVSETWLLERLSDAVDVKSAIVFTRASHDRGKTIERMLYSLGDFQPRTRVFDDRSTSKVVVAVQPDHECPVAGDTCVRDSRNMAQVDKDAVIGRLRDTLRALGGMFIPAPRMENALGVLECCDDVRYFKVIEALKTACLGDAEPGLTAPGDLQS
jgi:hypothetical protein